MNTIAKIIESYDKHKLYGKEVFIIEAQGILDEYIDNKLKLILPVVSRSLPTNEEIGFKIEEIIKKRYPYIKASMQDEIEAEVLKQGFLEFALWLQER